MAEEKIRVGEMLIERWEEVPCYTKEKTNRCFANYIGVQAKDHQDPEVM